jgi:hypothetical protein
MVALEADKTAVTAQLAELDEAKSVPLQPNLPGL